MKQCKWSKKKKRIIKAVFLVVFVLAMGFGGYYLYGTYKMNEISKMTYEEMLHYTTKNNKNAIITVGVIEKDKVTYKVYGEDGILLPNKEHTYEIGSITKTFTTSLLCKAITEDRVSLDDTIDMYLNIPDKEYYPTIKRLVTHTSGYKSHYFEKPMISNFFQRKNDFYGITEKMLLKRLGKMNLKDTDYSFQYSNFGFATLGAILETIYNEDYKALINRYILEDLELANTKISDTSGDLENYWEWSELDVYMPAGALLSNITDMMRYVQIQMHTQFDYLSMAHEGMDEVNATTGSYEKLGIRIDTIGAGWMIDNENNIIWHNGGTRNYNSYIGFDKENQIGVVVLSNLSPNHRVPATVIGIELLVSLQ